MAATQTKVWTEAELLALPKDGKYELVDGELVYMSPAASEHGRLIVKLTVPLATYVDEHGLGCVYDGQTGFWLKAENLRVPDLSFVRLDRVHLEGKDGFFKGHPDLAVEVLSPSERPSEILKKVDAYLSTGTELVWIINPGTQSATVYRIDGTSGIVEPSGNLDGENVVPGFSFPLGRLFTKISSR